MMRTRFLAAFLGTVALAGCGGDPADPDSGLPRFDGGPADRVAPTVLSTAPVDGESGVLRDVELVVRFSEPMAREGGTVRVTPGGAGVAATIGEWDEAGNVLTIVPEVPWPAGEVTLTFEPDFTDLAGNALVEHAISFTTVDDLAPEVISSTPEEGATGLSARTSEIVLTFDEPMRTTTGTLDVLGGAATIGAPTWSEGNTTVTFPVADLEHERDYDVTLRAFADASGNRLDDMPYLEDGVLDFSTGVDTDAPRVVRSEPAEGQLDVDPASVDAILVTFDEVMDTSNTEVTLLTGTTEVAASVTWTGSGRILRVAPSARLAFDSAYVLDLRALRDRAGNAIDEATYLVDGRLDFTVGLDAFLPFARASTPVEGESDVSYTETTTLLVDFSEAMDTTVTTAPLAGGMAPVTVTGTWLSATQVSFDVTGRIVPDATMSLDLTDMRDTRGNALDAAHRYLGDGHLDFTTSEPIGDGCIDPLTVAQGTVAGAVTSWAISSTQGAVRHGGTSYCDSNGTTANGTDVLIRFDKTSGSVASGGRLLRVTLDGSTGTATGQTAFDLAIATGACNPTATPLRCQSNQSFQQHDLDLPAGPVWIWVSKTTTGTAAAVVSVTEVDPPRAEGESCEAPFTAASAIHTTPSANLHRFTIPANSLRSVDIAPYSYRGNAFSCDTAAGHGIDAVVRFDKADDTSVLRVSAQRGGTSGDSIDFEVFDACDATAASTESLACFAASTARQEFLIDRPAGSIYLWAGDAATTTSRSSSAWVYNPEIIMEVQVIPDVQAGEICSRAFAAAAGATPVTGSSDQRLHAPSCFGAASNVEWYRLTTTQDVTFVRANAAGGLAFMDPDTAAPLACVADGMARTLTRVLPVGTEVCIGVEMGKSITSLDITGQTYDGLGSNPPVDLEILRPFSTSGSEESVASEYWMGISGSTLLMRHISGAVMDVAAAGGERAVRRGADDGITTSSPPMLGRGGVVVNGELFSFNSDSGASTPRVYRLWDGRSVEWHPVQWDQIAPYTAVSVTSAARAGSSTDILYVTSGTAATTDTVIYRVSALAPSTPMRLATLPGLDIVRGIAADDQFVYLVATVGTAPAVRGVYRLPRADLTATPLLIARSTTFVGSSTYPTAMALDSLSAPRHLYVRNDAGDVEAIIDPAGPSPFYLGPVIDRGTSNDYAMTIDPATGALYLFETETNTLGTWLRYDP